MIPFDIVYYRPTTVEEAVAAYQDAKAQGLAPFYYAGGTEIVTYSRQGNLTPGAVIDIKAIDECCVMEETATSLVFGAALPLNALIEDGRFPLLARASTIVDHTVRNRLTLGGNIAGKLPYRETVLPFLVASGHAQLAGPEGERVVAFDQVFDRRLKRKEGELLVKVCVDKTMAAAPWAYHRRVRQVRLDYPLLTACFLQAEEGLRMATTSIFGFPVRNVKAEAVLNDDAIPVAERPARAIEATGLRIMNNERAGAAYRRALLEAAISEALASLAKGEEQ